SANNFAFVGLTTCLGVGLWIHIVDYIGAAVAIRPGVPVRFPSARRWRIILLVVAGTWSAGFLTYVSRAAWNRSVQEFTAEATFRDTVHVRGLERLYWGEPTLIDDVTILRKADFERLVSYLSVNGNTFFVMGDSTILYGLLGTPSPQPLLYFVQGHSFL